jgi:hypothetical protein
LILRATSFVAIICVTCASALGSARPFEEPSGRNARLPHASNLRMECSRHLESAKSTARRELPHHFLRSDTRTASLRLLLCFFTKHDRRLFRTHRGNAPTARKRSNAVVQPSDKVHRKNERRRRQYGFAKLPHVKGAEVPSGNPIIRLAAL